MAGQGENKDKRVFKNIEYEQEKFFSERGFNPVFYEGFMGGYSFALYKDLIVKHLFWSSRVYVKVAVLENDVCWAGVNSVDDYKFEVLDRRFASELEELATEFTKTFNRDVRFIIEPKTKL